jgi:hypothetical protein
VNNNERADLGQQIDNRNPYSFLDPNIVPAGSSSMHLPANFQQLPIEEDAYVTGSWQFRDKSVRIAKAIRIPYTYQDKHGNFVREYLLIGYEGSGSD